MNKNILITLIVGIFLIGVASAVDVIDSHGQAFNVPNADTGQWGVYINTSCQYGTTIKEVHLADSVDAQKIYMMAGDNSSTLDYGTCSSGNCSLTLKPLLSYGQNIYLLVGMANNGSINQRQTGATTLPIIGTNVNWKGGMAKGVSWNNVLYEVNNITSSCEDTYFYNFNSSIDDISTETFQVNFSSSYAPISANLSFNGTNYTATISDLGSNRYLLKKSLEMVQGSVGVKYISFNFANSSGYTNSTPKTSTTITNLLFGLCNSSISNKYLNVSFKDESTNLFINASLPSASFTYWSTSQSNNKSYTLVNNSVNYEYDFCLNSNKLINSKTSIQYQSVDYPQRLYQDTLSLTTTITNKTLYLLSSTDGIYVTFQVLSSFGTPLEGVSVSGNRTIESVDTKVVLGTTDAGGLVTFWLNPDFSHKFLFNKEGYGSETLNLFPTQSSYTVTLGGSSTSTTITDYTRGITISIEPVGSIKNNTLYEFNYTISTNYWTLDSFGFSLFYGNGSLIGSQSSTTDVGGILRLNANTLNQTRIVMKYNYIVNSTNVNKTIIWQITKPSDFSIFHFFEDLNLYIGVNMFGINGEDGTDTFGKALLSVIILILVSGTLGYRYGIASEPAIMGIIFGIVLFLNSVGFIPNPSFLVDTNVQLGNFIVIVTALITIAMIFKGESR